MAKKGRKARVACLGCGSGMKRKDVGCRKCGTARPGSFRSGPTAGKAVFVPSDGSRAFYAKAVRPGCGQCGNRSRAGSRHCTKCGAALLSAVKSAGALRDPLRAAMVAEHDPVRREQIWKGAYPEFYRPGGAA